MSERALEYLRDAVAEALGYTRTDNADHDDTILVELLQARVAPVVGCLDCGLPYTDFPLDLVLPDYQWLQIHPAGGGILCAQCIVRRAAQLAGVTVVRAWLEKVSENPVERERRRLWLRDELVAIDRASYNSGRRAPAVPRQDVALPAEAAPHPGPRDAEPDRAREEGDGSRDDPGGTDVGPPRG